MLAEFDQFFDVRRFPPGRIFEAADEIHGYAIARNHDALAALADEARRDAMRYIELRARRMTQRLARGDGRTRELDRKVDGNFATLHTNLTREATDYADEPSGKLAQQVLDNYFPRGLAPITQVAFEEQVIVNEHLIKRLIDKHAADFDALGIAREVGRIRALLPHYRSSLKTLDTVSSSELGDAYERMQIALLRVIGWVMVMIRDDAERARAMRPIRLQIEKLAAIYAARRRGQPVPDDVAPDELNLDAEARAAVEAAAAAQAQIDAEVDADGAAAAANEAGEPMAEEE